MIKISYVNNVPLK